MKFPFVLFFLILAFSGYTTIGQTTANDHYDRGNELKKAGDIEGAIAAYTKAIETDTAFTQPLVERGELMAKAQ